MGRFRILRNTSRLTITPGASATVASTGAASATAGLALNGLLQGVIYTAPASVDSSATVTFSVIDQDGNTVWSKTGVVAAAGSAQVNLTPNATAGTNQAVPLSGYYEVRATYSAAQPTTASTTEIVLLIDEG